MSSHMCILSKKDYGFSGSLDHSIEIGLLDCFVSTFAKARKHDSNIWICMLKKIKKG